MSNQAGGTNCTPEEIITFVGKSLGLMIGKEKIMAPLRSNGDAWFYSELPEKDLLVKVESGKKHVIIFPELNKHWPSKGDTNRLFCLESFLTENVGFSIERKF